MDRLERTDGPTGGDSQPPVVLLGRYAVEDRLATEETYQSFAATDSALNRSVAVAAAKRGETLLASGRALAGLRSPHVVNLYDAGHDNDVDFVVFERPAQTVAALSRTEDPKLWNAELAMAVVDELVVALDHLEAAGIATDTLHLGSIGLDHAGHVRLSPWALTTGVPSRAEADGTGEAPSSELALPLAVLSSTDAAMSPGLIDVIARASHPSAVGGITTRAQLEEALGQVERDDAIALTGMLPSTPGVTTMTPAVAMAGAAVAGAAVGHPTVMQQRITPSATGPHPRTPAIARRHRRSRRVLVGSGMVAAVLILCALVFLGSPPPTVVGQSGKDNSPAKTAGNSAGAATPLKPAVQQTTTTTAQPPPTTTTTRQPRPLRRRQRCRHRPPPRPCRRRRRPPPRAAVHHDDHHHRTGVFGLTATVTGPGPRSGEMGLRSFLDDAVDRDIDLFVVEGDQSSDREQLAGREVVGPGQFREQLVADPHRPVQLGHRRRRRVCAGTL